MTAMGAKLSIRGRYRNSSIVRSAAVARSQEAPGKIGWRVISVTAQDEGFDRDHERLNTQQRGVHDRQRIDRVQADRLR